MTTRRDRENATEVSPKAPIVPILLGIVAVTISMVASPVTFSAKAASQAPGISHEHDLITAHELIDGRVPDGAVKVPASEIPADLKIEVWRQHGVLYVVSATILTEAASRPSVVITKDGTERRVSIFTKSVYFPSEQFMLKP